MNIKALKIFSSVIEHGSLAKASNINNTSESAASRQLNMLEHQLNLTLFSRNKRSLVPTPQGLEFYKEVHRMLSSFEELPNIAKSIRKSHKRKLSLIAVPRVVNNIVAPALAKLCNKQTDIEAKLEVIGFRYIDRWVAGSQYHLGIGPLPLEHRELTIQRLCSVPAVVVLPAHHELSDREELSIKDLKNEPFVSTFLGTTSSGRVISSIFNEANQVPSPVIEVANSHHACSIVSSGFGYAIADPFVVSRVDDSSVKLIPLNTNCTYEFGFYNPINMYADNELVDDFKEQVLDVTKQFISEVSFLERSVIHSVN